MSAPPEIVLPAHPRSAREARQFVAAQLENGYARHSDTAQLLVSELVTNAILHARTRVCVRVVRRNGRVRVEVVDHSQTATRGRRYSSEATTGRGLGLVEALADEWGVDVDPSGGGKTVWFEVS